MRISDWSSDVCSSDLVPWVAQAATVEGRERLRDSAQANRAREDFNRSVQALGAAAAASPFPDLLEETRAFSTQALGSLQAQPSAAVLDRCRARRQSLQIGRA